MSIYKIGQSSQICLPSKCNKMPKLHYGNGKGLKKNPMTLKGQHVKGIYCSGNFPLQIQLLV